MIKFEEGENIEKIVRKHFFVMVPITFFIVFMALIPLFFYYLLNSNFLPFDKAILALVYNFLADWGFFVYFIWLLILWVLFFIEWTDYYLDSWVITNKRIVDIDQRGFFHREVTSLSHRQIQDITVETKGLLETFLKFGTLHIQTAGHDRDIIIKKASNPEAVRILILKLQEKINVH